MLTDIKPDMSIVREEIFGPVVVAEPFTETGGTDSARQRTPTTAWRPASGPATSPRRTASPPD